MDREDPSGGHPAAKAGYVVLVDLEVLADDLAQEVMGLGHIVVAHEVGLGLDRAQGPLGVLGDLAEHPLPGRL